MIENVSTNGFPRTAVFSVTYRWSTGNVMRERVNEKKINVETLTDLFFGIQIIKNETHKQRDR